MSFEDEKEDDGERRRALSDHFAPVQWPPRLSARIHYNSGWAGTSWSGEVRAVVDGEVAVVLSASPAYAGRSSYKLLERVFFFVQDCERAKGKSGGVRYGPLPRELCKAPPR